MAGTQSGVNALIWHNPRCSKSREVLGRLHAAGFEVRIYDYLEDPPTPARLKAVADTGGIPVRDLLRDVPAHLAHADDDMLAAAMAADPSLIQRPIVETPRGTRLCRPPERVQEII